MNTEVIKREIISIADEYPIKKVLLFGSRAAGTNREDSDIDLIIEFFEPVSLITLSAIRIHLEETLKLDIDIIHGPIQKNDMIDVNEVVELYAA